MRNSSFFSLYILFMFIILSNLSASVDFFNPNTSKAKVLRADPEQALVRTVLVRNTGGSSEFKDEFFWDVGIGGDVPLFSIFTVENKQRRNIISTNVRGFFKSRFNCFSGSFDLWNTDYYGGISTVYDPGSKKLGEFELYFYHESSHLGDELMLNRYRQFAEEHSGASIDIINTFKSRNNYSREVLRLLHFKELAKGMNLAYGLHYIPRRNPSEPDGKFILQADLSYTKDILGRDFFVNTDIKVKEEHDWGADLNIQLGMKLGNHEKGLLSPYTQMLVLEYYDGYSYLGQFFYKKDRYVSFGIIAWL